MKKQFDLQYYLEHPETKVVTRDGRDVRILCTDLNDKDYPIAATFIDSIESRSIVESFTSKGMVLISDDNSDDYDDYRDLFFDLPDPVKKRMPLTYDDLLERVKSGKVMWLVRDSNTIYNIVDFDVENVYYVFGDVQQMPHLSYEELMNGMTFANGDPTWKEVENERRYQGDSN